MKHRVEYLTIRLLIGLVRAMPAPLVSTTGAMVGLLAYVADGNHRRIARENVAAAFPARTPREHRRIVRGAFQHFGRLLFELLNFSTLSALSKFGAVSRAEMLQLVEFEGEDRVGASYAHGKGVLFVTGPFGYWELQAMVHALRLPPMAVMARALDNPALNSLLEQMRTRTGNSVIYRRGTIRRVMRQLQAGGGGVGLFC